MRRKQNFRWPVVRKYLQRLLNLFLTRWSRVDWIVFVLIVVFFFLVAFIIFVFFFLTCLFLIFIPLLNILFRRGNDLGRLVLDYQKTVCFESLLRLHKLVILSSLGLILSCELRLRSRHEILRIEISLSIIGKHSLLNFPFASAFKQWWAAKAEYRRAWFRRLFNVDLENGSP